MYQLPHIGNYRTFLFEDILQRYLEYLGYDVERMMAITDVEDKSIAQAEMEGRSLENLSDENCEAFLGVMAKLGARIPDHLPRSSTTIDQAVDLIEDLLRKGFAYWHKHEGRRNVYYDPTRFSGFGSLYGLDMGDWPSKKRRFHRDTYPDRRWNRGDFILWHGYTEGDGVYWSTRLGKGRPAWNIQDPAMIAKHLDFRADIACGGEDNLIRHHDYVKALVESVTGKTFSHYWLHGAPLTIEGKEMSKSEGNIVYPRDLVGGNRNWKHVRFYLINSHYRKELDFTPAEYDRVSERLDAFRQMTRRLGHISSAPRHSDPEVTKLVTALTTGFETRMNDDLHIGEAFKVLVDTLSELLRYQEQNKLSGKDAREVIKRIRAIDQVLEVVF